MTSIHLNDIALPKKFEKLPLSYYINVKSESEFSKNFSKIFFFNVISQTYPKMVLRNAILQKFCHHKNDSKPFPSPIGCLGLNLLKGLLMWDCCIFPCPWDWWPVMALEANGRWWCCFRWQVVVFVWGFFGLAVWMEPPPLLRHSEILRSCFACMWIWGYLPRFMQK